MAFARQCRSTGRAVARAAAAESKLELLSQRLGRSAFGRRTHPKPYPSSACYIFAIACQPVRSHRVSRDDGSRVLLHAASGLRADRLEAPPPHVPKGRRAARAGTFPSRGIAPPACSSLARLRRGFLLPLPGSSHGPRLRLQRRTALGWFSVSLTEHDEPTDSCFLGCRQAPVVARNISAFGCRVCVLGAHRGLRGEGQGPLQIALGGRPPGPCGGPYGGYSGAPHGPLGGPAEAPKWPSGGETVVAPGYFRIAGPRAVTYG